MSANRIVTGQVEPFHFRLHEPAGGELAGLLDRGRGEGRPGGAGEGEDAGGRPRDPHEIEREAFEKGFAAGERAGMQLAEKKTGAILKRFAESLDQLTALREEVLKHAEKDLVALAVEIARKLVHREIQLDEKIIITFVRVALEKLNADGKVTMQLNPKDKEILEPELEGIRGSREMQIVLKGNEELKRGDCIIESEYGAIDARVSEQFKNIEQGLFNGF